MRLLSTLLYFSKEIVKMFISSQIQVTNMSRWRASLLGCVGFASMSVGITAHANGSYRDMRIAMREKFLKHSNGSDSLSAEEFARSALKLTPEAHIAEANIQLLRDIVGGDTISLEAYQCFMLLLGTSFREIKTAFLMFDISNTGSLNRFEYELLLKSFNGGVGLEDFPPLPQNFDDLITKVRALNGILAKIEFNQFGAREAEVSSFTAADHLGIPTASRVAEHPPLTQRDWNDLMRTSRRELDICFTLRIFNNANRLNRDNFCRAIQRNCRIGDAKVSQFLWTLFYNPETREFDIEGFQRCLRERKHFGIAKPLDQSNSTSERNLVQRFAYCMQGKAGQLV